MGRARAGLRAAAPLAIKRSCDAVCWRQVCSSDAEVDAALDAWAAFGTPGAPEPAAALPPNPLARLWGAPQAMCYTVLLDRCLQCCQEA